MQHRSRSMRRAVRCMVTLVATLNALPAGAAAPSAASSDLRQQIEAARRDLRLGEERVDRLRQQWRDLDRRWDECRRLRALIVADLDRLPVEVEAMRRRLPEVEQALATAVAEAEDAADRAREARRAQEAAEARVSELKQALASARVEVAAELAASPEALAADEAVARARASVDAATADVLARLAGDPAFAAMSSRAAELKLEVEQLRAQASPDRERLARQSQAWMNAQSKAGAYQGKAVDGDEQVRAARSALLSAQAQQRELASRHAAMVDADARVAAATAAIANEAPNAESAEKAAIEASTAASRARARANELSAEVGRLRASIAGVQARVEQLNRDFRGQDELCRRIELDVVRVRNALRDAELARQRAAARLADLLKRQGA